MAAGLGLALAGALAVYALRDSPYVASHALVAMAIALAPLAWSWRGTRRGGALGLAASLLVTLAALDAEVSILFWPRITVDGRSGRFVVADPLLGYGPRPGVRARVTWRRLGRTIYDARYTIDADGFRATRGSVDPQAECTVFLGDSYTFGDGLNDSDTLPQRYADATGRRQTVINAAFSGYGPGQALRLLESGRLAPTLSAGRRLIVYPVSDVDLGRSDQDSPLHRVGTPRYARVGGRLRFLGAFDPGLGGALAAIASKSAIVAGLRDLALAAPDEKGADLFGAMAQAARWAARGRWRADFLVLLWDEPVWQDGGDVTRSRRRAWAVAAMAGEMQRRGVPFLRVSALIPDYRAHMSAYVMAGSGHPSALLNRRLAAALATRLADRSTFPGVSVGRAPELG